MNFHNSSTTTTTSTGAGNGSNTSSTGHHQQIHPQQQQHLQAQSHLETGATTTADNTIITTESPTASTTCTSPGEMQHNNNGSPLVPGNGAAGASVTALHSILGSTPLSQIGCAPLGLDQYSGKYLGLRLRRSTHGQVTNRSNCRSLVALWQLRRIGLGRRLKQRRHRVELFEFELVQATETRNPAQARHQCDASVAVPAPSRECLFSGGYTESSREDVVVSWPF